MNEITYQFKPAPTLTVNGHAFELRMSDSEIFGRSLALSQKYAQISDKACLAVVVEAVRECIAMVDDLLGEGAMKTISGGKPVCLVDTIAVMMLICEAACADYVNKLAEYE